MNWRIDFNNLNIVNFDNSPVHVIRVNGQDAWTDGVIVHFMVGDVEFTNQMVSKGGHATRPTTDPVVEGYTFVGWSADGLTLVDFENFEINEEINIYAALSQDLYESNKNASHSDAYSSSIRVNDRYRFFVKYESSTYNLYRLDDENHKCEKVEQNVSTMHRINDRYFLIFWRSPSVGVSLFDVSTMTSSLITELSMSTYLLPDNNCLLWDYNNKVNYVFDKQTLSLIRSTEGISLGTSKSYKEYDSY